MDLSKLPRLSKTQAAEAPAEPAAAETSPPPQPARRGAFCDRCGAALRPGARFCDSCGAAVAAGTPVPDYRGRGDDDPPHVAADIWFSLLFAVLFVWLGHGFASYLLHRGWNEKAPTSIVWSEGHPKAGQEVQPDELEPERRKEYDQNLEAGRQQRLTDAAMLAFGLALFFDAGARLLAVSRFRGRRAVVGLALLVTAAAVALNLYAVLRLGRAGVTPILSILCVAFGGYTLIVQWATMQSLAPRPDHGVAPA